MKKYLLLILSLLALRLYIFYRSEGESLKPYGCDGGNPGA